MIRFHPKRPISITKNEWCTAGNFDLPDHGFLLLTWSTGPMDGSTGNSYQAEALTNVLRYHTCRSSLPEDGSCLLRS